MSFQLVMIGAMAAMSAAQAASSAAKGASDSSAAAGERGLGDMVKAAGYKVAAAQTDVGIKQTQLQTQQQEEARRMQIAQLWQANAIDLVARGGVAGEGGSGDVAQAYNKELGDEDLSRIRLIGESQVNRLSFRRTQQLMGVAASELDAFNAREQSNRQIEGFGQQAFFQIGQAALSAGSKFGASMGGGSGYTTNADMLKTDAEIRDWSSYDRKNLVS
jgi:hypothetical protein